MQMIDGYYTNLVPIGIGLALCLSIKWASDFSVRRGSITLRAEDGFKPYPLHDQHDPGAGVREAGSALHLAALHVYEEAVSNGSYEFSSTLAEIAEVNHVITLHDLRSAGVRRKAKSLVLLSRLQAAQFGALCARYTRNNALLLFSFCSGNLRCDYASNH